MAKFSKYILLLLVLELLVIIAGFLVTFKSEPGFKFPEVIIVSVVFSLISLVTLIIFFRGQLKEPVSQTMHTLVSVSLKFLIELAFVAIWFFLAKKTAISSVILFFVLYLTFTLFSVIVILKTLKNKSL